MKTGTMSRSRGIATGLTYFFLIAGALLMIFPFLWMILTSLKSLSESVQIPPTIFPAKIVWSNFKDALTSLPFVNLYINTIIMVLVRVICAIVFSSMAGYAFAKLHFKGKNLLFTLVLVQMMMPSQIFVIPQYQMLAKIGEAAYLDGCNQWQTFTKVMLPLTGTSVAALTIFTAVFAYADLMWPLVVNTDINLMTLSSGLATLKGQFMTNYPVLMAGSLFAMIPMLILYLIFQRQFIEGIALTGSK